MAANVHVLVSSSVPPGIRGSLNQWYIEVQPGVFVGRVSARIRDYIWSILEDALTSVEGAYAASITQDPYAEQGFTARTVGTHDYEIRDFDGLQLVARQHNSRSAVAGEEEFTVDW